MPSLYLFHRRTVLAGDDLQPASILTILVRLLQIFVFVLLLSIHIYREMFRFLALTENRSSTNSILQDRIEEYFFGGNDEGVYVPTSTSSTSCTKAHEFPLVLVVYLFLSTLLAIISIVLESKIYLTASIGTPIEAYKRNPTLSRIIQAQYLYVYVLGNSMVGMIGLICAFPLAQAYFACRSLLQRETQIQSQIQWQVDERILPTSSTTHSSWLHKTWWIPFLLLLVSQGTECIVTVLRLISLFATATTSVTVTSTSPNASATTNTTTQHPRGRWSFYKSFFVSPRNQCPPNERYQDMDENDHGHNDDPPNVQVEHSSQILEDENHHNPRTFIEMQSMLHGQKNHALTEEMWDQRCRCFFTWAARSTCFLFGGREYVENMTGDYYGDIARTLADFFEFGDILDLAPTDIAIGIMILQRVQRQRALEARKLVQLQKQPQLQPLPVVQSRPSQLFLPQPAAEILQLAPNTALSTVPTSPTPLLSSSSSSSLFNSHGTLTMDSLRLMPEDRRDSSHWYETKQRRVFSRSNEEDLFVLSEGAHFARYALAIYTWILYVYMKPVRGLWELVFGGCRDMLCRKRSSDSYLHSSHEEEHAILTSDHNVGNNVHIVGDNWLRMHTQAFMRHIGSNDCELVHANFKNKYNQMPYCIVLDHQWQSVVVAIRGTLSLEDCLIDVLIDPEPLDDLGREFGFDGNGEYCHGGVLSCAKKLYRDLEHHQILDRLLLGSNAKYRHYQLRIVGHSLGAGCAVLLGYFYRRKFPSLRVLSYSPPGGFITWRLAIDCKVFVISFVLDTELVPRLKVETMEHLRNEILDLFGRIKLPKVEVARSFVSGGVFCDKDEYNDPDFLAHKNNQLLHPPGYICDETDFFDRIDKFKSIQDRRKRLRGERRGIRLYAPGRLIHFVRTGEQNSCFHGLAKCLTCCSSNIGYEYTPVWAENDDLNEILVSPTMFTDHFPNRVCLEIEEVAKDFGITGSPIEDPRNRV